jgi:bile acid-coenzyme A ligase
MTPISFPRALAQVTQRNPGALALLCGDQSMTYGELDRASNRMARAFGQLGVKQGDLVTIGLPSGLEWFVACMAAWKLGATPSPMSAHLPLFERDVIIERAAPALIVGVNPQEFAGRAAVPAGFSPDPSLSDEALADRVAPIERVLTSGGSTGHPKLILTQTPAVYDPRSPMAIFSARRSALIPGPLYHGIPFSSAWRSLFAGASVVVMTRFDASQCLELIERHRVDRVWFVPTMMLRMARLPEQERRSRDLSSLEFVMTGGSPCPRWLMQFWIDWVGPEVMHESYGSTERLGGTFIKGTEWLQHPGSVGRAVSCRIRILDPQTGDEQPPGIMGEIYMMPSAGPNTSYRYVGAQGRVTHDGWESVGDMGCLDADGYLYLGDRRTDMILCRGRNVYPAEVEAAIEAHPRVRSSVVIGLPDEDLGQRIHAIVEAESVGEQELKSHVSKRLVHYKVPSSFEFVKHPLRDDSGKVRRSALRAARMPATGVKETPERNGD